MRSEIQFKSVFKCFHIQLSVSKFLFSAVNEILPDQISHNYSLCFIFSDRMDVTSHSTASNATEGGENKSENQSECIVIQPTANGTLPHHSTGETIRRSDEVRQDELRGRDGCVNIRKSQITLEKRKRKNCSKTETIKRHKQEEI